VIVRERQIDGLIEGDQRSTLCLDYGREQQQAS
jgi:hypothetical protein